MAKSTIPLTPVVSNQLAATGYDPATKTLAITFKNKSGVTHPYHYPCTQEQYDALCASESKGKWFNTTIKGNPAFPATKMVPDEEKDAA